MFKKTEKQARLYNGKYVNFKDVKVNDNITLSIAESGKTIETIKKTEKVVKVVTTALTYLFIVALALIVVFPFYWMIITSLKQNDEILQDVQRIQLCNLLWHNSERQHRIVFV